MRHVPGPVIQTILNRRSVRPRKLSLPVPNKSELGTLIQTALAAPDHGQLNPVRFIVVSGQARATLGKILATCHQNNNPDASDEQIERQRDKALKAPMLIGLIAHIENQAAISAEEQRYSCMISAGYLMLAADEMGFGSIFLSGEHIHDRVVCRKLGLADNEQLLGWINIGTPEKRPPPRKPAELTNYLRWWDGN